MGSDNFHAKHPEEDIDAIGVEFVEHKLQNSGTQKPINCLFDNCSCHSPCEKLKMSLHERAKCGDQIKETYLIQCQDETLGFFCRVI